MRKGETFLAERLGWLMRCKAGIDFNDIPEMRPDVVDVRLCSEWFSL
jgi:hypothetical protein